ncbi:MAG: hypothetical protein WCE82_11040 [Halobacteriota archaeon]
MLIDHGKGPEAPVGAVFRPDRSRLFLPKRPPVSPAAPMKGSYGKNDNLSVDRNVTALSVELPGIYAE